MPVMTKAPDIPSALLPGGVAMPMVGFGTWQLRGSAGVRSDPAGPARGLPAHRHRHHVRERGRGRARAAGQRAGPAAGVPHHQAAARARPAGSARRCAPACARWAPTTSTCGSCTGRRGPRDRADVARVPRPPRGGPDAGGGGEQLLAGPDRHVDQQVTGEAPAVNQIPWSPARYDGARAGAQPGAARGDPEGYSPLKGTDLADPVLTGIAARHGVTPAQVVLRWHLEHGIAVIPKSARPDRIAANIDVLGFSLSPGRGGQHRQSGHIGPWMNGRGTGAAGTARLLSLPGSAGRLGRRRRGIPGPHPA